MLACFSPGQSAWTFLWASRKSWSRPGLTLNRTALNAVMRGLFLVVGKRDDAAQMRVRQDARPRGVDFARSATGLGYCVYCCSTGGHHVDIHLFAELDRAGHPR